jgi:hypothetical protein
VARAYAEEGWIGGPTNAAALARRPQVKARIDELAGEAARLSGIKKAYLQRKLLPLAESNVADFLEADQRGQLRIKDLTKIDRQLTEAVASVKAREGKVEFKLWDKNAAIANLLRSIPDGFAADRLELTGRDGEPIQVEQSVSENEPMRRAWLSAQLALEAVKDNPVTSAHTARMIRAHADRVLLELDPMDVAASEEIALEGVPAEERARNSLAALGRAIHDVWDDHAAMAFVGDALRKIPAALEAEEARRPAQGELEIDGEAMP